MIELPIQPVEPLIADPRVLVIYSLPKAGKTTIESLLPNCLILDLEGGTDFLKASKFNIIGLRPDPFNPLETDQQREERHKTKRYYLSEVVGVLRNGHPFKYIALDTATMLQEWCEYEATVMYMNSVVGQSWNRFTAEDQVASKGTVIAGQLKPRKDWKMVTTMGKGYGYRWLIDAYTRMIGYISPLAPTLIINAHIKYTMLTKKEGKEVEMKDLDLTGKIKSITAGLIADAIGYFYRDGKFGYLSFVPSDEVLCGSRVPHLEGKNILISEKLEDGSIKTYWNNIFKELDKK